MTGILSKRACSVNIFRAFFETARVRVGHFVGAQLTDIIYAIRMRCPDDFGSSFFRRLDGVGAHVAGWRSWTTHSADPILLKAAPHFGLKRINVY